MIAVMKVKRHSISVRFVHWSVAISTFILIFSGFGQMPMYRRYMIDQIPGLSWSSDFAVTLIIHYAAAALLIFAMAYHLVYHLMRKETDLLPKKGDMKKSYQSIKIMIAGGSEPKEEKYLAKQRLAYAYIASLLLALVATGMIKVYKNLPGVLLSEGFMLWVTNIHNLATMLLIVGITAHLTAFIFKTNRRLLPGMFTGMVDKEHIIDQHSISDKRLKSGAF